MNGTSNQTFLEFLSTLAKIENNEIGENNGNLFLIIIYSLIIIVSFVGNFWVCKVMFGKKGNKSMTTTDILIINLAIGDLLMTLLNIPFNIARFVLDNWPFGETLCVLVPFTQSMSVHCSSITMMFIAIERYKSICHNKHLNDTCFCELLPFGRILSIIWLSSALFSIPHALYHRVIAMEEKTEIISCLVVYPEPKQEFRQLLTLLAFLSQYVIPISLTCVCYLRIICFLWRKKFVGTLSEIQRISLTRRKRQRINMLFMVVLVFAICWLPLNVFHLLT